jgi:hypothetical protein
MLLAVLAGFFVCNALSAKERAVNQDVDTEYTQLIKEATTRPEFLNPLTSYLPKVEGIPTPKDMLGYIVGAPGKLTYYADIISYMNSLAKASPNVQVFPIGKTSEGREMFVVAVSNKETMKELDKYKELMAKLADPRLIKTEQEAERIISQAKPIYLLTGGLHSCEVGASEVSMELAYRLAVDENPVIKKIRDNMIVLISPGVNPDGHDKHTDWFYKYNKDIIDYSKLSGVPYWGKYIFHDNNRDMIAISQPETQNVANTYFEWHPVVHQDNHESIPFLCVVSGTGPYNDTYDPSVTSEWNLMAWWNVTRLTSYGMPGVWTHDFWDGWAPNYLNSVANNHNAIGLVIETYGNNTGNTMERETEKRFAGASKSWCSPLPYYKKVVWSIRNNVNYQQCEDLSSFYFVATNKEYFLKNFWKRGKKSFELGKNEPPYAYIIPSGQKDPLDSAYLVNILLKQKIEVHQAKSPIKLKEGNFPKGSYIIKMDQPYRNLILNLLGIQKFPKDAPRSYDDTGWTLGFHMDVKTVEITDKTIFNVPVDFISKPVMVKGEVVGDKASGAYIINNGTINNLLVARLKLRDFKAFAAEDSFQVTGKNFDAGSMIIPVSKASAKIHQTIQSVARELGLDVISAANVPDVKSHELDIPRIAIYHTWYGTHVTSSTQDDGWVRFAFDQLKIPFAMINKDHLRKGKLKTKYDVIVFSNCGGRTGADIVNGLDHAHRGSLSYVKSPEFKHLGTPDSCEDITGGMGIEGVGNLEKFVKDGGLLILLQNPVKLAVDFGMVRDIRIYNTSPSFYNPGSFIKGEVVNEQHPIAYGYSKKPFIFLRRGPLLRVPEKMGKYVVLRYADEEEICLSGIVKSEKELRGKPAVIDVPIGAGHIVFFTFNPFWRDLSHGSYMFVFNAILNYNDLRVSLKE